MMRNIYCALLAFILHLALGDEYNLFGDAGQAYSVEVNIGHPPQKVNQEILCIKQMQKKIVLFSIRLASAYAHMRYGTCVPTRATNLSYNTIHKF